MIAEVVGEAAIELGDGPRVDVAVRTAIEQALAAFFAVSLTDGTPNPNVDFGANLRGSDGELVAEIPLSDVFNVVRDVAGVRKVGDGPADFLLNGTRADVELEARAFPALGAVTLLNGATGQPL